MQQVSLLLLSHVCSMIQTQKIPMIPDFYLIAASGAEMDDGEQIKKNVPLITCEITFGRICLPVDVWCRCTRFESLDAD